MAKYKISREAVERLAKIGLLTDRQQKIADFYFKRGWHIESIAAELDVNRRTVDRELKKIRDLC